MVHVTCLIPGNEDNMQFNTTYHGTMIDNFQIRFCDIFTIIRLRVLDEAVLTGTRIIFILLLLLFSDQNKKNKLCPW